MVLPVNISLNRFSYSKVFEMKIEFKRGYTVFKKGKMDCVFAALHSGPAIENPVHRDDNSETIASLSWKEMGGTLIVGGVSRDRLWGIDYNRDVPALSLALKNIMNLLVFLRGII